MKTPLGWFITLQFFALVSVDAQTATPTPASAVPAVKRTVLKYSAPKTSSAGARIDGDGGSRGSGGKLPLLYVLTPNHTALTTKAQPSLFWFQSGTAATRFELTLIEPKNPKPLLKLGAEKADQAGIHRISLAKQHLTLTPGTVYRWTIALVLDASNRSQDVIASGSIQRIEPDAALTTQLSKVNGVEKAAAYASAGVWYDALEEISDQLDAAPKSAELHAQRAALLEQVGLKEAASAERK